MPAEDLHSPVAGTASPSFIETFMLRGGELIAGELHRERMLRTLRDQGSEASSTFLQSLLSTSPWREVEAYLTGQQVLPATTYRLTLEYSLAGLSAIRLIPYCKRTIRALRPILLPDGFDYSYKYADRRFFERVKAELASDEEPLFVRPDSTITDTSFTNVLIETEAGYLTPTRPLLKGTQREGLLRAGLIAEADGLTLSTLRSRAKAILLINALLPLEEALRLPPEALQD
ncbi:MAG: hypothetical protein HXN13_04175 [Porphyromonadaceae bacterium]|nr:hypothetical protein [Porphyromonadaceae bacterium]